MTIRVTDHALLRYLERAGGFDVEGLRRTLAASLRASVAVAEGLGLDAVNVRRDGLVFVVREHTLVTVAPVEPRT